MRSLLSTVLFSSSLVSSLLVTACTASNPPSDGDGTGTTAANEESAQDAVDSADSASAEGNVMMAVTDGASSSGGSVTLSATLAANISARFTPSGCTTVTPGNGALKVVFDDCTGPRGLAHLTGELDLTGSISLQGAVTIKGTSSNLQVNGAQLDIDATGTYAASATGHTLTVATSSTGTGAHGGAVDHDGSYTIGWDAATQCHSLDGQWSTEVGSSTQSDQVDLSQCGGCPTGSIAHTFADGKTLTVTYDGSATAAWSLAAAASATGGASGSAGGASGSAGGSASGSVISSGSITVSCQ